MNLKTKIGLASGGVAYYSQDRHHSQVTYCVFCLYRRGRKKCTCQSCHITNIMYIALCTVLSHSHKPESVGCNQP